MSTTLIDLSSIPETPKEQIRELRRIVAQAGAKVVASDGRQSEIPEQVQHLLLSILNNLQAGKAVSIVPEHQQITTQRAADILGVSRPFLVRLVENGDIPFHMVGTHRRIYLRDLLEYKSRRDKARHEAINNIARMELEAGTYDDVVLPDGASDE